jgi:hypothetical protein
MRIDVPAGGPDALKEALRSYASSHDLRFSSTWGVEGAHFPAGRHATPSWAWRHWLRDRRGGRGGSVAYDENRPSPDGRSPP